MNRFLSDASRILASPGNHSSRLQRLARAAVPALSDFCFIFVLDGAAARCAACAHATREGERLLRGLNRVYRITLKDPASTVAQAMRSGRPQLRTGIIADREGPALPPVFTLHRRLGCRSALAVPIGQPPRVLGAISLCYSMSGRCYTAHDVPVARRLAALLAAFLGEPAEHHAAPVPPLPRRAVRLRARA